MRKLFIFAIVVLGAFACKTSEVSIKPESNSNANANSNVVANANSPVKTESETNPNSSSTGGNPREELVKSSKKFVEQKQFRANIKGVGGEEDEKIMVMEYVAPDRYRLKDGKTMDAIVIGKDFYMNINGKWQKAPGGDADGKMPTMRDMFTEEGLKSMKDVEYVGEETVGGKTARVYRYKSANIKDMPAFDAKIWIGKDSELPLQIQIDEGENKEVEKVLITYDYDPNIKIEVPAVK
jgi:hypothetical protein